MVAFQGRVTDAVACAIRGSRPSRARRAAIRARLALRVGLSTGVATSEEDDWFGTPVVEAARLCTAAGPSQILASEAVRLLVDGEAGISFIGVGTLELKGFPEPRPAYESRGHRRHILGRTQAAAARRHGRRTVCRPGRRTRAVADAIVAARAGRRRTVLVAGLAGIGKTRLVAETVRDLDDTAVLAGTWAEPGTYRAMSTRSAGTWSRRPPTRCAGCWATTQTSSPAWFRLSLCGSPTSAPGSIRPGAAPNTVTDTVVNTFARIAAEIPLVFVLRRPAPRSGPGLAVFLELATRPDLGGCVGRRVPYRGGRDGPTRRWRSYSTSSPPTTDVVHIDVGPLAVGAIATIAAGSPSTTRPYTR